MVLFGLRWQRKIFSVNLADYLRPGQSSLAARNLVVGLRKGHKTIYINLIDLVAIVSHRRSVCGLNSDKVPRMKYL
jgi:hypothetical protein